MPRRRVALAAILSIMTATAGQTATAKTTINFWHNWNGAGGMVMSELLNGFAKSHKDIEVKVTQTAEAYEKLLTTTAAGNPPDVVLLDRYLTANYAARNVLLDLGPYIKRDGIKAGDFWKAAWDEVLFNGRVYGLPMTTDCRTLWYNGAMFQNAGLDPKRPPKTWAEVSQYNAKLTRIDADGTIRQAGYVPTWEQGNVTIMYLWQNNADVFNADQTRVAFDSQASIDALKWIVDGMDRFGGTLGKFGTGGATFLMYKQRLAMELNGPWMLSELVRNASKEFKENVRYAPVPYFKAPAVLAGGHGLVIPAGSKHRREAWELLKYMTSYDRQSFFGGANGAIPALKSAALSKEYMSDPFRAVHVGNMDVTRARPVHPAYPDVEALMDKSLDWALAKRKGLEQAIAANIGPAQKLLDTYNSRYLKRR